MGTAENMCLKRALKKGGISTVEGISLGCSSKNEKINLQMEITYASLSDFWVTREVKVCGVSSLVGLRFN